MYNEDIIEVKDLDECIAEKKALIEEAKKLEEIEDKHEISRQIYNLKRAWRRIPFYESHFEGELEEEFDLYIEKFYAEQRMNRETNKEAKLHLISKTKELLGNGAKANVSIMSDLMVEWKKIGSAGRDEDEELWTKFNDLRKSFFDQKHKNWEEMQTKFANAKSIKEELITKVEAIANDEDIQKTNDKMNELFEQWKSTPRAGGEEDDVLWERFNNARQVFYARRKEYYDEMHQIYNANLEKKKALIKTAKEILETNEFTKENTNIMKDLGVSWKEIGSCGRYKDDHIWKEFRNVMDKYFESLKASNEKRRAFWIERMNETKAYKNDLILKQKRQLDRLERELSEALSESIVEDYKIQIEDKKAFISELEKDIKDIEVKLAE